MIRFREDGGGGLIHKGRGQSSNHSLSSGVREYVLQLVKSKYADFGPTLATEVLLAKHDMQVGPETLLTWMLEDGLWQSRKQRRSFPPAPSKTRELRRACPDRRQRSPLVRTLNIEILCANSSQAKGRVERANRTLQDRLVKELRLAEISDMSADNAFLPEFMKQYNEKFSLSAVKAENMHRRLNVQAQSFPIQE